MYKVLDEIHANYMLTEIENDILHFVYTDVIRYEDEDYVSFLHDWYGIGKLNYNMWREWKVDSIYFNHSYDDHFCCILAKIDIHDNNFKEEVMKTLDKLHEANKIMYGVPYEEFCIFTRAHIMNTYLRKENT